MFIVTTSVQVENKPVDIQFHSRTTQIQLLSRHLYRALSAVRFVLHSFWLLIAYFAVTPGEATLYLGDTPVKIAEGEFLAKGLILGLYAIGLFLMLKITHHFRNLMYYFEAGNIFERPAIDSVHQALKAGIAFATMSFIQAIIGSVYTFRAHALVDISFTTQILVAIIYFGLMYTLLWTLEIGHDLKDESEMTI
ncbi:hypothetical protein QWI17_15210 [Gilvimarinus sp. SDUM040013]|uniref:DUF2975 domain-containing protein n=1 Tax=Gilvimarinus gilvus TaxID=3058038 RepID=A0ABU4S0U5_9GAMM|nr:hypothetical protein [Gilvimarinus sp. SDUM040013]MDO3387190.1 hypothetical protein [Gilvimarinus sp. SDUM040013]MDX6850753.1 hypothetical protein [Gilvimarinus sp. SDUM040013]